MAGVSRHTHRWQVQKRFNSRRHNVHSWLPAAKGKIAPCPANGADVIPKQNKQVLRRTCQQAGTKLVIGI